MKNSPSGVGLFLLQKVFCEVDLRARRGGIGMNNRLQQFACLVRPILNNGTNMVGLEFQLKRWSDRRAEAKCWGEGVLTEWRLCKTSNRSTSPRGSRTFLCSGVVDIMSAREACTSSLLSDKIPIEARVVMAPRFSESLLILRVRTNKRIISTYQRKTVEWGLPFQQLSFCSILRFFPANCPQSLSSQNRDMPSDILAIDTQYKSTFRSALEGSESFL